jgi:hypothetical protein
MPVTLKALKPFHYGTRMLRAGDEFDCQDRHVKLLTGTRPPKAQRVEQVAALGTRRAGALLAGQAEQPAAPGQQTVLLESGSAGASTTEPAYAQTHGDENITRTNLRRMSKAELVDYLRGQGREADPETTTREELLERALDITQ